MLAQQQDYHYRELDANIIAREQQRYQIIGLGSKNLLWMYGIFRQRIQCCVVKPITLELI